MSRWRTTANSVIAKVIASHPTPTTPDEMRALRKAISAAYPWGEREHHPYKIWLSAVRIAINRLATTCGTLPGWTVLSVRCPTCNAGIGIDCKPLGHVADTLGVLGDALGDGLAEDSAIVAALRKEAVHESRLIKSGVKSRAESLPLFEVRR